MKKFILLPAIILSLFFNGVFAQIAEIDRANIKDIYENADRLFFSKRYIASLEYLQKDGAAYLSISDSLQYLKIKNLEKLYSAELKYTKELESSLKFFFARGNKYAFPELKYGELTAIYSAFQTFKEKDKLFHDSISKVTNLESAERLPELKSTISNYLSVVQNTYYKNELSAYLLSITNKLTLLAARKKKREQDSTYKSSMKAVGKNMHFDFSYLKPSDGKTVFTPMSDYNSVVSFFDGKYTGALGEKYSLNASLGSTMINIYSGTHGKLAIDWHIIDVDYAVFDWASNAFIKNGGSGTAKAIQEMKSIKAGTRIGPLVAVLLTKKIAASVYYNAKPGVQFLMQAQTFSTTTASVTTEHTVEPVYTNFNLAHEFGMKIFLDKLCLNPYLHIGEYNWQNNIISKSPGATTKTKVQAKYECNSIGIRLGF